MTDQEWDEWATRIETRAKRLFAMALSLAGALALTVAGLLAAWHQVIDAQQGVADNTAKIVDQEVHLAVTDERVDETPGAPPPDPEVEAEARKEAEAEVVAP